MVDGIIRVMNVMVYPRGLVRSGRVMGFWDVYCDRSRCVSLV